MAFRPACTALVALLPALAASADVSLDPLQPAVARAIARVRPSVVRIEVVWLDYGQGREVKHAASGSGFVIGRQGYLVTNHHVAGRAARALCIFADNEEIAASLVGTDPLTDVAVLKLQAPAGRDFPAVEWGDSASVAVGDTVLAMGSPLALAQAVTRGIVSNATMIMPSVVRHGGGLSMEGEDVGSLVRWIAHDAAIYPGNSGGPLVDLSGRVIGVNEISLGLGGAIPSRIAREVAEQIIARGRVTRSWLGFEAQALLKGSGLSRGVLLSDVVAGSPAARAGMQPGDVLVQLDGQDLSVRFDEELPLLNQMVAALPVGRQLSAVVLRGGQEKRFELRTAEREPTEFQETELKEWGLTVKNVSAQAAREKRLDGREGVLVTSVRAGGPSGEAKPALQAEDVIRRVAGQPLRDVAALVQRTRELQRERKRVPVTVEFIRGAEQFLTVARIGIGDAEDPSVEARRAWLPAAVQVLTRDMAEQLGVTGSTGVRVTQVYRGGTAEAAGLAVGDLLLAIDGEPIPASQPGDEEVFLSLVRQRRVGDRPELTVSRGGRTLKLAVELVRSPRLEREMRKYQDHDFEFSVRDRSFMDTVRELQPEDTPGVLVTEVKDGGWAALGELHVNDVIRTVDGEVVADTAALEARMKALRQAKARFVVFGVLRQTHRRQLELETSWQREARP